MPKRTRTSPPAQPVPTLSLSDEYGEQVEPSESVIYAAAESVNAVIFVMIGDHLVYVNAAAEGLTGYSLDELRGMNILTLVHSEHRKKVAHVFQAYQRHRIIPARYEFKIVRKGGDERWIDLAINKAKFEGDDALVATALDITRRKQAEAERNEALHRLEIIEKVDIELAGSLRLDYVLQIALDAAVRLSHADAGALHLIEDDRMWVAWVIGNYPRELIGSRIPMDVGIVGRVVRQVKPELISDVTLDPDYVPNVVETRAQITVPLISNDRLIGVMNVQTTEPGRFTPQIFDFCKLLAARIAVALDNSRLYDTTRRHLAELESLYQQVSALEQLKTQIIRVAAHDLRNPLSVISGCLQMLTPELDPALNARTQEYHQTIHQAVERMEKITRDILTLERISGRHELMDQLVDMAELVSDTSKDFCSQLAEKRLQYNLEVTHKIARVRGDRALLRETIGNLISNAIKYTPEGGKVQISLNVQGARVIFLVVDTGYGIPQEAQEGLFQPFYRVKTDETRTIKGTGLGLHLVKNIIDRHGGTMRFHSQYGTGSTFGFELPLARKSGEGRKKREPVTTR
ncbi:MAG: PAS domain S-box protein [Anaerolineae bacterium]|nr:PAS domain S-box protein [Anaerolineae bacterium]